MGKAYRLVAPVLTAKDIMRIKDSRDWRLTTSPFGLTPAEYATNPPRYLSHAVPWKGHPERMPPKVKAGLEKAIKISKKYAGTYGTVIWHGRVYPKKAIEQKKG